MTRWAHRLPVQAAVVALAGGLLGSLGAVGALVQMGVTGAEVLAVARIWVLLLPLVGAAAAVAWWASRQARTLRGAVEVAHSALPGRALSTTMRSDFTESAAVAQVIQALVDRAEHNTRELSQRQAYAAVGEFAGELARELAPSVAAARSSIRALENNLHLDSPLRAPLTRAQRELHRIANTLQDTLRLARSGKLAPRRIDLWQPLRCAVRTIATDAQSRGVWLEAPPFGSTPVWVNGDLDALEQLFVNLMLNAVQATDAGGRVDVQVSLREDVVVTVTDTGRGIPGGALDRVFEPFYTTRPDRAGLGLAIAWRTAAAHGGRLAIESALGRGTTVEVSLPRSESSGVHALEEGSEARQ